MLMAKDTVENQIEESLGLYPRFNREEAQAQAKRKPPSLDELNYNKPLVSYKKTTNAPSGQDKIADISSLSRLNSPPPQGEKESLNVGPFTYNSGRNSLTGSAFVEKRSTPNTTYPDGAVVNTQGKAVGLAINGRLLLNKEGDNSLTAGFNKVKNTSNTNVQLPDGKTQQFSDGSTAKGYNLGATLGRFIFDARKNTSTKGKDRYSGKVTYLLGDNADISIQDSTGGDTTLGFNFRKSFNHGGLASEHQDSDPEEMGYVEQAIKLFGSTIGFPNALDIFKGEPEETPEVVAPEVMAPEVVAPEVATPEVVAPEVVAPADTQTQEAFELDTDDSIQSDEVAPLTNPQEEPTVEPIESVELDNAIDDAVEEAIDSVVQTDDEKYANDAQYQEFGIPTGQDDREVSVVTNKIVELGYLIRERALRAVTRLDNVEYVPTGPFRMLSGLTQIANLETVNKFLKQAVGYKASDFKNTGGVDPKLDVSKEGINWCAAFVNHILTELGADTLGKGKKGYNAYLRNRADAYKDYGQDIYTRKDGLENYGKPIDFNSMQEGDIILIDFDPPGKDGHGQVDHVGFWAGNKVRGQEEGFVSVIGGNQGPSNDFIDPALQGQEQYGVTIKRNTYRNANILGVRRITYDNDAAIIAEDQKSRDRMSIFHGLEPSAASFISTDEVNASNAPRKSLTPLVRPDTLPTPTTDFEGNPIKTYAQGGLTSMNDQTQMAFALGGEAETVDPVSGNDVPPGSLPEEVRDDIDAKLSEGEYVVPADVVRFFGVKYFEDLRAEAKMGLQQMDADGRIGGEPVLESQPQGPNDSMDVAELKAALSKSGMYAGGLAKGDTIDSFIDDASRDPMVNGRMRAGGATVKMAVGGLVPTGTYGDVNKVDGLIKQLMTAANKDPSLMKRLASKGITLNKTGANQDSNEMKKTNRPKEPIKAAAGTYINYSNNYDDYNTLGAKMFMDANVGDPKALINSTLLSEKGEITQITLIAPDGSEIPVAWNTSMPIPPGFSVKGEETEDKSDPDKPKGLAEREDGAEQRAQDAIQDKVTQAERFNYDIATPEELYDKLKGANNARNIAAVAGVVAGPLGIVISTAASVNNSIVTRRVEKELEKRIADNTIDPKTGLGNAKGDVKTVEDLMDITNTEKAKASTGFLADIIGKPFDKFFDGIVDKAIISDKEYFGTDIPLPTRIDNLPTTTTEGIGVDPKEVSRLNQEQQAATSSRLSREAKQREAREAAQKQNTESGSDERRAQDTIDALNRGEGISDPLNERGDSDFDLGGDLDSGIDGNKASYGSISSGGIYQEGGLVAKPANKKQNKKRTTQRRKGLGTRP